MFLNVFTTKCDVSCVPFAMMYNCQILHCQACNCGRGSVLELVQRRWLRRCSDDRAVQPWHCRRKQETELFHSTLICTFSTQWPPVDNVQCDAVRRHRGDTGECSNPVRTGLVSFSVTKIVRGSILFWFSFTHCAAVLNCSIHSCTFSGHNGLQGKLPWLVLHLEGREACARRFGWFFLVPKVGVLFEPKNYVQSIFCVFFGVFLERKKCGRRWSQEFKPGLYCRCFIFCF